MTMTDTSSADVRAELDHVEADIVTFQASRDRALDACDLAGYWYSELQVDRCCGLRDILRARLLT